MALDDAPQVRIADRPALRAWLAEHAASSGGVWIVTVKGRDRAVEYDDIVEELLCVGWVDSLGRRLDDRETMLYVAPRKPGSAWSRPNKERIARLEAAGLMLEAGRAVVEAAKASGRWTALDEVEQGIEPPDLTAALDASPAARSAWDGFPRSTKRAILEWISTAKTTPTRERRIATTVSEAAIGRRANQPRQPGTTP